MFSRQFEIRKIIQNLEKNISIPNHIGYETALNAEDERVLAIFDMPHAEELFTEGALSLDLFYEVKTFHELNLLIDNYLNVINFYRENHDLFSRIITLPFFHQLLAQRGEMECWNQLIQHPFKKLSITQSTTMVIDALTRLSPLYKKQKAKSDDAANNITIVEQQDSQASHESKANDSKVSCRV